jgi:hypothetical protein
MATTIRTPFRVARIPFARAGEGQGGGFFRPSEGLSIFAVSLAVYFLLALDLVFRQHAIVPDALSRVGNAYYVLFSRDPHLAAIGFVWNPLPSLLVLPLLPLKAIWPALVQLGFAGNIVTAIFMAGAVFQMYRLLLQMGVGRALRLALVALFALHPMVLYSGANGASEAILLFFLLLSVRSIAGWLEHRETGDLVTAGLALGCAYLTHAQALPAAAGAVLLVGAVSFIRASSPSPLAGEGKGGGSRLMTAACDVLILAGPMVLAVGIWTVATWLITGDPLHQLASVYGNSSQIQALRSQGVAGLFNGSRLTDSLHRLLALEPGLPAALALALLSLLRRPDPRGAAAIFLLGPVLILMFAADALGLVLPWLRNLMIVIPLTVILAGLASSANFPSRGGWGIGRKALAVGIMALALPASLVGMLDAGVGREEAPLLKPVLTGMVAGPPADEALQTAWSIAHYLDARHLPDGSVLVDSFSGYPIILASSRPRQFVITNDRDFQQALTDPAGSGIEYLLVPASPSTSPSGSIPSPLAGEGKGGGFYLASLDALNRAYPNLYSSGAGIASLTNEFAGWRLYHVQSN